MSDLVRRVTWDRLKTKKKLPPFDTGDTVGVYVKVKEGEKERIQLFEGVVIKVQNSGAGRTFTVRKISSGVGVERTWPLLSPAIDRVELISRGKVRRARLFHLRGLKGRQARLDSEIYHGEETTTSGTTDAAAKPEAPKEAKAKEEKAPKTK
ncbi:MAG: 50S ribosomal protein L19 [Bdellovibrionales bacterium]